MTRSTWWMIGGVLSIIGGLAALFNPLAGSIAAVALAGWAFLILGILQIAGVFMAEGTGNKIWLGLWAALSIYLGISLLSNPLAGMLTLTLAVAILLLVSGATRLIASFDFRGTGAFWALLLSAAVSILLGVMIMANYPVSAASILGVFLGVELLFNGFALVTLASAAKRIGGALRG